MSLGSFADISRALDQSSSFRALPKNKQSELREQASTVFNYLDQVPNANALAVSLADSPDGGTPASSDPTRQAGEVARSALDSIAFPDFVASLVQGTFQAIVDSSIQQMEAYSQLLASVSKTVDQFMDEHVTDDMARDHLTQNYGDVFQKEITNQGPQMTIAPPPLNGAAPQLPNFLQDMGFTGVEDIDEQAVDEAVIPQVRRTLAETRHQSLATMVMMGLNRIVVDDGEINAKLIFSVDATQNTELTFDDTKTTNWGMSGTAGRNPFGAGGIVVTTTNVNSQSNINLRAELTGEVKIRFKSDYFPLERFADSQAIQLINHYAKPFPNNAVNGGAQNPLALEQAEEADRQPVAQESVLPRTNGRWGQSE